MKRSMMSPKAYAPSLSNYTHSLFLPPKCPLNSLERRVSRCFSPCSDTTTSTALPSLKPEAISFLRTLSGHTSQVSCVAFSSDGQTMASGSSDATIKLWNLASGQELRTLAEHTDVVWSVAFRPDGQILASGSNDNTIKIWGEMKEQI